MDKKIHSGMMLTLLLMSILTLAFNIQPVKASDTIYIRADGSIDPPRANITTVDNVTYTFTDNINQSIMVERSNVVINGNGYTLEGSGSGNGFSLHGINNVTIKKANIKGFLKGIYLYHASNIAICRNNITANIPYAIGIHLEYYSANNVIWGNNIEANHYGIRTDTLCEHISIFGNDITNHFIGIALHDSSHINVSENFIFGGYVGIHLGASGRGEVYGNYIHSSYPIRLFASGTGTCTWYVNISENDLRGSKIHIWHAEHNKFFHNNIIISSVIVMSASNIQWDDGYPSAGNYWGNYVDTDQYSGPHQNETGSDGIWDHPYIIDANNTDNYPLAEPWSPAVIEASVDIDPDTLNLKSNGEWITAYIELPEGHSVSDIDVNSILLNDTLPVDMDAPTTVGDYDLDNVPDLMVKFDRAIIIQWLNTNDYSEDTGRYQEVNMVISGTVAGTQFSGKDEVKVLRK